MCWTMGLSGSAVRRMCCWRTAGVGPLGVRGWVFPEVPFWVARDTQPHSASYLPLALIARPLARVFLRGSCGPLASPRCEC